MDARTVWLWIAVGLSSLSGCASPITEIETPARGTLVVQYDYSERKAGTFTYEGQTFAFEIDVETRTLRLGGSEATALLEARWEGDVLRIHMHGTRVANLSREEVEAAAAPRVGFAGSLYSALDAQAAGAAPSTRIKPGQNGCDACTGWTAAFGLAAPILSAAAPLLVSLDP